MGNRCGPRRRASIHPTPRRLRATATVAAAALSMTAAGTLTAPSASAAAASALPTLTIAMDGHHIHVGGALVSGAHNLTATTSGEPEGDIGFIHLNGGVGYRKFWNYLRTHNVQDPNQVSAVGALLLGLSAPRGTTHAQTRLPAGNYVAFDTYTDAGPLQWPHTTFHIAASSHPAPLPAPRATVHAIEFGFRTPATLHQHSLVRFENDGYLVHMVIGIRARNNTDAQKLVAALRRGDDGTAQRLATGFAGFMEPVSHGGLLQEQLDVAKGVWVLSCFMDTQDGREHTQIGMVKIIRVA